MDRTREIPKESWANQFDQLSRAATGVRARVEVTNAEIGDEEMANLLPFNGVELDLKGSGKGAIAISLDSTDRGGLEHFIYEPARVFVLENDAGEVTCVAIEHGEGGKTLLFFERPISLSSGARGQPAPGPA